MGKASSAKKVAKLAEKDKGRKVRFQGGSVFPAVVLGVALVGTGLVVYSRATIPDRNVPPTINDHWHVSYGFYACGEWLPDLQGNKEEQDSAGNFVNEEFRTSGVHSHDDGVIHWHPYTSAATGRNAKLGVFLDTYGVELSDTKLVFPEDQGGQVFEEGVTTCEVDGEEVDAELSVILWDSYNDPESDRTYITGFRDVRFDRDNMAIAIVFAPEGTNPGMPPTASSLPELGAADAGPETGTTEAPTGTTVPAGAGTTVAPSQPAATEPGVTEAPATTGG